MIKRRKLPMRIASRRGIAAMMAMLFLVLISTLAVGFYAATNTSVQLVHNEEKANNALIAAESGMEFIRYHLKHITVPYGTQASGLFNQVAADLQSRLNGTMNLNGASIYAVNPTIQIPANQADPSLDSAWVKIDNSGRMFRIQITQSGNNFTVKAIGRFGSASTASSARGVKMEYGPAQNASAIFDYGVASRGTIATAGSSRIKGATDPKKGSVLSTTMSNPTPVSIGGKEVSGDISITNPSGTVNFAGASVGGTTDPTKIANEHIHKGVPEPEFPTVDTSIFLPFVKKVDGTMNYYTGGTTGGTITNGVIKANSNTKFTGKMTIKGVLYVEAPNSIEFRGGVDITGLIVVPNSAPGTLTSNVLDFSGNVTAQPVTALDPTNHAFDGLRDLKGAFILAPNFTTSFSGSFGTVNGSIISSKMTMSGNAGGTVQGSVINLNDTALSLAGSSEIVIASTGTTDYPAGVYFSSHYAPLGDTYAEFKP
jgi:hypothetical protein